MEELNQQSIDVYPFYVSFCYVTQPLSPSDYQKRTENTNDKRWCEIAYDRKFYPVDDGSKVDASRIEVKGN